ncbi:MAG: tetratricopeptide repeat protein [Bacteroidales bacterium]|nr:tetratricopeptide repeat protein [Candidatus Liminaster caballi]
MKSYIHKLLLTVVMLFVWTAASAQRDTPPEGSTAYYELNIRSAFKNGDWSGGKALLDEAIEKYPHMSAFHELMGRYYVHGGTQGDSASYDKARYHLIRAISIDEKNVNARMLMLQVETDTHHYSSAIVYCNDLLEENPYNENLWRKKIDLYRKLGNNAEADRLLDRIVTIYPGDDQLVKDQIDRKTTLADAQRKNGDLQGQEQTLRELVDLDPGNSEHHLALVNLLYRNGRKSEAAEAAARGATETKDPELVKKRASILCEMNRHREAVNYVREWWKTTKDRTYSRLLSQLEMDAARATQYDDAFIAYAKLYDSTHSLAVLDNLISMSIQRWYLDDALVYINESIKRRGENKAILYKQYLVHKRLGNTRKANGLLEELSRKYPEDEDIAEEMAVLLLDETKELIYAQQYSEAIPKLEQILALNVDNDIRNTAFRRLYNCYIQNHQYARAEQMLAQSDAVKYYSQIASLYNDWGKPAVALDFLANAYRKCPEDDTKTRTGISDTYEEIALPYVRDLLAGNMVVEADKRLKEATEVCGNSAQILRYAITAAQRKGDTAAMSRYIAMGRQQFPDNTYFILKEAQMHHLSGDSKSTLSEIAPLLSQYTGDSVLIAMYVESSIEVAEDYLRDKQPDMALQVIGAALDIDPGNQELYYIQGRAYEQKKEWQLAFESYQKYKPGYGEVAEYKRHLDELLAHTLQNSILFEYQQARPGNEDIITGNAYITYSRKCNTRNTVSGSLAYAGRDGVADQGNTELTRGGTGVQATAGWEHSFTGRLTGKIEAAVASRYFPIVMARLGGSYELRNEWQLSAYASYRLLRSYAGLYGWQSEIVGFDRITGDPIYGDPEYVRVGWHESKKSMLQVGAGLSKTIEQFILSGEVSGLLFDNNIYFNTNAKMQFFPTEGNPSNIFAVAGIGTAPESSLIDRSMPVGFNKLNTFVGFGGLYFLNRNISLGLSGTWYTMLTQSERLTTTYTVNDPYIREDYRNYFYIHANVKISF